MIIISENNVPITADNLSRFSSAPWADTVKKTQILIGGVGGIGSWTSLLISRLSPRCMTLCDPDTVDSTNLGGQLYSANNIGENKTTAMASMIRHYSAYFNIHTMSFAYTENCVSYPIMIGGFDNMEARTLFFNKWKHEMVALGQKDSCLFIDGRLTADEFQIFCMRGDNDFNIKRYEEEFLFNDSEAEPTICSFKQTSYCAAMIASFITNLLVNHCANIAFKDSINSLPFITRYNANTMFLKTEL